MKNAKNKDLENLKSRFNLDFADPKKLAEGFIGLDVIDRVTTVLKYIELARKHLPDKKEEQKKPEKIRAKGMDIVFPGPGVPPRFWWKHARLTGDYNEINFSGDLKDLSTNQGKTKKPFVIDLNGKKQGQLFNAHVKADHTGTEKKDSMSVEAKNVPAGKMAGRGLLSKAMKQGSMDGQFQFYAKGEKDIGGQLEAKLTKIKLDNAVLLNEAGVDSGGSLSTGDELKANFVKSMGRKIESYEPGVTVTAKIIGTWEEPSFKLSTNLTSLLQQVVKESVGEAVKSQSSRLEAKLDAILKDESGELTAKINDLASNLTNNLGGLDADVKKQLEDALGVQLNPLSDGKGGVESPIKLPGLDKIFK